MRVLWCMGWDLAAPTSGGPVYSLGLLRGLADIGADVVVLHAGRPTDGTDPRLTWQACGPARGRRASVWHRDPAMIFATGTPTFRAAVDEALGTGRWDAVVADHLMTAWIHARATAVGPGAGPLVLVTHNHEGRVRTDASRDRSRRLWERLALSLDASKVRRAERAALRRADLVTAITDADEASFQQVAPGTRTEVLPPGYAGAIQNDRRITRSTPRRAVVVGNFDWHVKQANLERLLDAAAPVFGPAGIELRVVGFVPDRFEARVGRRHAAVRFTGSVASLERELEGARVAIVSEPIGGGFKLKALDYVFHRVPIAVRTGSMTGLPLRAGIDHLEFPHEDALAHGIRAAIDDLPLLNTLHERAFRRCAGSYDWSDRAARLVARIAELGAMAR